MKKFIFSSYFSPIKVFLEKLIVFEKILLVWWPTHHIPLQTHFLEGLNFKLDKPNEPIN